MKKRGTGERRDVHPLLIFPTGVPCSKRCLGEALLPTAAGSAVKANVGSWDPPLQFISAIPSCFQMVYSLYFLQCYSGKVCNVEWEVH